MPASTKRDTLFIQQNFIRSNIKYKVDLFIFVYMNSQISETIAARAYRFWDNTPMYFSVLNFVLEFSHASLRLRKYLKCALYA